MQKSLMIPFAFTILNISGIAVAKPEKTDSSESKDALTEKPPMVLQNRYFLKALRPELNVFGGSVQNEAYSKTWAAGGRLAMFFTETLGAEYAFTKFISADSADLKALQKLSYCNDKKTKCTSPEPSFNRLTQSHDFSVTFAPIYGKVNFMDLGIVYSDIYANLGFSLVGQRFYFAKSYNIRIDGQDKIFAETRENLGKTSTKIRNALVLSIGFSAFLWE
jgi:hypothetical protein